MSKVLICVCFLFSVFTWIGLSVGGVVKGSKNVLLNSSCESVSDSNKPLGWSASWSSRGDFVYVVDEQVKYRGRGSIKMVNRQGGAIYPRLIQTVTLDANSQYCLSAWVLSKKGRANFQITPTGKTWFGNIEYGAAALVKGNDQWQLVKKYISTEDAVTVDVVVTLETPNREVQEVWIDDVQLNPVTEEGASEEIVVDNERGPDLTRYIPQPNSSIVLPQVAWAKPLSGRRPRILFMAPQITIRDVIELSQRMDVLAEIHYAPTGDSRMKEYLQLFSKSWDAIVLGSVDLQLLKAPVRKVLWSCVRDGVGLFLVNPSGLDDTLEDVLQSSKQSLSRFFFSNQEVPDLPLLPWLLEGADLRTGLFGEGRVAVIDYQVGKQEDWGRKVCSLFPPYKGRMPRADEMPWWEPYYALLAGTVLWTIDTPACDIVKVTSEVLSRDAVDITLKIKCKTAFGGYVRGVCVGPGNRVVTESEVILDSNSDVVVLDLRAPFITGDYFIWLSVENEDGGKVSWAAHHFKVAGAVVEISTDQLRYSQGDEIIGFVNTANIPLKNKYLEMSLVDYYGRIVDQVDIAAVAEVSFNLKSDGVSSTTARVVARVFSGDKNKKRIECEGYKVISVVRDMDREDYLVGIWASYYDQVFNRPWAHHMLRFQRELGVDFAYMAHSTGENYYQAYAEHNMWAVPEEMKRIWFKEKEPYLSLDLTNPEFKSDFRRSVENASQKGYRWGAFDFSVGDECGYALRYNETTYVDFRDWLKARYENLEHLNRVWATDFLAWNQVCPKRKQDVDRDISVAPYLEFCTYSDELFVNAFGEAAELARNINPHNRIGLTGTRDPGHYIGYDWYRLMQVISHLAFYDGIQREAVRSFKKPGDLITSFVGFDFLDMDERNARYFPWLELFNGFQGVSLYSASSRDWHGYIRHDLSRTKRAEWLVEELDELKKGIGRAVLTAKRNAASIAVLHSQRSLHVVGAARWRDNATAICETIKDMGLQFDFVADEQLTSEILYERAYEVLILPMVASLSDDEAKVIEHFTQNGGRVIAIGDVGEYDQYGAKRSEGVLDHLFGITRLGQENCDAEMSNAVKMWLYGVDLDVVPAGIALANGMGKFNGLNCYPLSQKIVGKGEAICLNFLWTPYRTFRAGGIGGEIVYRRSSDTQTAASFWRIMEKLLSGTGIECPVDIKRDGKIIRHVEQVVYTRGAITYCGLLPRYFGGRYTKATERILIHSEDYMPVDVVLRNISGYVYDVRERRFIGKVNKFKANITDGVALFYALVPYEIKGVELSVPTFAHPGDRLDVDANLLVSNGDPGDHVIHLRLIRPDGKIAQWAQYNLLTKGGKGQWCPQLALNALPGTWRIEAQELMSGLKAYSEIEVR